jgi:hypothetical protein
MLTAAPYGDPMQPDTEAWDPWHPRDFAARMPGADFPWYVAGGWAIDLSWVRAPATTMTWR